MHSCLMVWVDEIGDPEALTVGCINKLKARLLIHAFPIAKLVKDILYFFDLILGALTRIYVRDMKDGLLLGVEDLEDVVYVRT